MQKTASAAAPVAQPSAGAGSPPSPALPDDGETLSLSQAERNYEGKPPSDAGQAAGARQQGDPFFLPAPETPTQEGPRGNSLRGGLYFTVEW